MFTNKYEFALNVGKVPKIGLIVKIINVARFEKRLGKRLVVINAILKKKGQKLDDKKYEFKLIGIWDKIIPERKGNTWCV